MKKFLCIFLCMLTAFSSFCFSATAKADDSNFINTEKNRGDVAFDCDFAQIGVPMGVIVSGQQADKLVYRWYIDNILIENNSASYTPLECDLQSMVTVVVFDMDGNEVGKTSMYISNLPVVYIETENRTPITSKKSYIDAHIKLQGNKEFSSAKVLYDGEAEIRGRGNSTWQADKKPYKIKLGSKSDILGMGKNKHWVLLSNPFDTSLIRNHISYNLAADMGLSYQKSEWVDVVLNGKVIGNYQLCEHVRVDDNRVEITDWEDIAEDAAKAIYAENTDIITKDERDELIDIMIEDMSWTTSDTVSFKGVSYTVSDYYDVPDINGGYLTEIVRNVDSYTFVTDRGMCVDVDTPETISEDMHNYIQDYYQSFEDALFSEDFCTEYNGQTVRYTDFIDLESFVKGFLLNELFENYDFGRTSVWISKEIDGKLVYGPVWDMDNTLISTSYFRWTSLNIGWLKRLISDPVFLEELRKTYFEYRYTAIQDILKDGGDIDKAISAINSSADYNDKIWENTVDHTENALDLKLRLQAKVNWFDSVLSSIDNAYGSLANGIANIEYVNSDSIDLNFSKEKNSLSISFKDKLPSSVKIFADTKLCNTITPDSATQEIVLPKITEGAIISVFCYDKSDTVISGSCVSTVDEVTSLKVTNLPDKLTYNVGETIDLQGLVLTAVNRVSGTVTVKPDLVYTYAENTIGEKLFAYGKVTEAIGDTYVVLRCGNASVKYKINVNPREDYGYVSSLIAELPAGISSGRFIKELFEAQAAFDALSTDAQAKVSNRDVLTKLFAEFSEDSEENDSVVACTTDGVFRTNARSNLLIISKGEPKKLVFINSDSSTATYDKNSMAFVSSKKVGDYTVTTIKHMISAYESTVYSVKAIYPDNQKSDALEISVSELLLKAEDINHISYPTWVNQDSTFTVRVNTDSDINRIRIYENDRNVTVSRYTEGDKTFITAEFAEPGVHTVSLRYLIDGSWVEHSTFDVYVREYVSNTDRIYSVSYPSQTYSKTVSVKVSTSADVTSLSLVNGEVRTEMTATEVGSLKFWSADVDITDNKEYDLYMNGEKTQTVISSILLDSFLIEGTKLVKFLADTPVAEIPEKITEIEDDAFDGFEGTILCYPGSVAEEFAKGKGISYETFNFTVNVTEIDINEGESFRVEITATPYLPSDFEVKSTFDESIISFNDCTVTALTPGYTRLILNSPDSMFSHTVYVSVGGGPKLGDVSADKKINSLDALFVLQASVQSITLNAEQQAAADINRDGKINSLDALIILQISTEQQSIWDYI